MNTILVGVELGVESYFKAGIEKMPDVAVTGIFTDGRDALAHVRNHKVDLAVLDMELPGLDGIELGIRLRDKNPCLMLIYVTERQEHLASAIRLRPITILMQPYTADDISYALETACLLSRRKPKRIYARTFGHFDLFLDDKPVMLKSAKAKELLALLIDRQGGAVDSDQIIGILWHNRPKDESTQSLCSKLCKTLYSELQEYGIEELLISSRGSRSINLDMLDCDLYDMLAGDEEAKKLYYGEYLADYEWAEYRNYSLSKFV